MNLDKVFFTTDSERKTSHDEVMIIFRRHAEELVQIIKRLL